MLSTWALIVCSLSPDCLSACSKPSRIGWFASCMVWTRCSYVWASSASLMEPLSFSFPLFLSQVSSRCQDRLAILEKNATTPALRAIVRHREENGGQTVPGGPVL